MIAIGQTLRLVPSMPIAGPFAGSFLSRVPSGRSPLLEMSFTPPREGRHPGPAVGPP